MVKVILSRALLPVGRDSDYDGPPPLKIQGPLGPNRINCPIYGLICTYQLPYTYLCTYVNMTLTPESHNLL